MAKANTPDAEEISTYSPPQRKILLNYILIVVAGLLVAAGLAFLFTHYTIVFHKKTLLEGELKET